MDIQNFNLSVPKTSRISVIGEPGDSIEDLWIVCHGYGQLSKYFIRRFFPIGNDEKVLIVAPEGLHRFYTDEDTGRIGASWMTSEERLTDIKDYVRYLDSVYEDYKGKCKNHKLKVHLLGFSQGSTTVSRWLCRGKVKADNLILWAGQMAHDLNPEIDIQCFKNLNMFLIFGDNDQYYSEKNIEDCSNYVRSFKDNFRLLKYRGGHTIDETALLNLNNIIHDRS